MPDITMKAIQNEIDALTRRMDKLRATLENAELRRDALQLTLEHFQPAQKQKRRRATTLMCRQTNCVTNPLMRHWSISPNETRESCLAPQPGKCLLKPGYSRVARSGTDYGPH